MDSTESDWTRNLLVFSPFGLSAAEPLQGRIPPFRDSYQTALFLTVMKAVGVEEVGTRKIELDPLLIKPRLFELGRSGFVDLSDREGATYIQNGAALLHPAPVSRLGNYALELAALALATAILAGVALRRPGAKIHSPAGNSAGCLRYLLVCSLRGGTVVFLLQNRADWLLCHQMQ